ncbi:MAG: DMP19 family protein [Ardenticatenaceae bacterium]|nr:DMP19 family protein [Anaerolineales bacterium]MCB8977759.1 DMP19 family protein [Ardenticatenaceae bacterium]
MLFSKKVKKILKEQSGEKAIIEIDSLLTPIFHSAPEKLSNEEKTIVFIEALEREINNGGFSQFFFNSSGDFVAETVAALKTIGSTIFLELLETAIAQFPDSYVPKNQSEREDIIDRIEDDASPVWQKLEAKFYRHEENIYDLMLAYISANIKKFR